MDLTLLYVALGSLMAIAALVGLNTRLTGWRQNALPPTADILNALRQPYPDLLPGETYRSPDALTVLVADTSRARIILVAARGAHSVHRPLGDGGVRFRIRALSAQTLLVRLADYTFKGQRLAFDTPEDCTHWNNTLSNVMRDTDEAIHSA